jgi:hypothetical protein
MLTRLHAPACVRAGPDLCCQNCNRLRGNNHAAHRLSSMWTYNLRRGRGMPAVRSSEPPHDAGRSEMLRLFGSGDYEMPEVQQAELCTARQGHLRVAWRGRGIRTAVRKLLRVCRDMERTQVDHRGSDCVHYHLGDLGASLSPWQQKDRSCRSMARRSSRIAWRRTVIATCFAAPAGSWLPWAASVVRLRGTGE